MHKSINKRKARVVIKSASIAILLFLLTLVGCFLLFYVLHKNASIMSPLGKIHLVASDKSNVDEMLATIKDFCDNEKLSCATISSPNDSTIDITLQSDAHILLSPQKDVTNQLSSLQLTMQALKIEGKQFKRLDFRFDKVIVSL